jgi:hypothetical protein
VPGIFPAGELFSNKKSGGPGPRRVDRVDKAVPEGCSLEHKRWQRGGTMEAKVSGSLSLARGRRKAQGSSGERGKGVVRVGGARRLFLELRDHRGGMARGGNEWC